MRKSLGLDNFCPVSVSTTSKSRVSMSLGLNNFEKSESQLVSVSTTLIFVVSVSVSTLRLTHFQSRSQSRSRISNLGLATLWPKHRVGPELEIMEISLNSRDQVWSDGIQEQAPYSIFLTKDETCFVAFEKYKFFVGKPVSDSKSRYEWRKEY